MENEKELAPVFKVTEEMILAAKTANPGVKLCLVTCDLDDGRTFEGIFKEPSGPSVARVLSKVGNIGGGDRMKVFEGFVSENIVAPTTEQLFAILKELPALSVGIAGKLLEGKGLANEAKKKSI